MTDQTSTKIVREIAEQLSHGDHHDRANSNHLYGAASLIESLSAEKAGDVRAELEKAEWVLRSSGFRRCDIPACNCNSWHHVGGYAERFREIKEAVEEAGYSTNGKVLLDVIADIIALAAESTVARLTGEKNDPVGGS